MENASEDADERLKQTETFCSWRGRLGKMLCPRAAQREGSGESAHSPAGPSSHGTGWQIWRAVKGQVDRDVNATHSAGTQVAASSITPHQEEPRFQGEPGRGKVSLKHVAERKQVLWQESRGHRNELEVASIKASSWITDYNIWKRFSTLLFNIVLLDKKKKRYPSW